MTDRNEILANFQAVTGIEDFAVCFDILEQKEWDLMSAVNSVMPQGFSSGPAPSGSSGAPQSAAAFMDLTDDRQGYADLTHPPSFNEVTARNVAAPMMKCCLRVYFQSRLVEVQLPVNSSVAQVKDQLERETGLPPSEQILSGWPMEDVPDETKLQDLGLDHLDLYHLRLEQRICISPQLPLPPPTSSEDTPSLESSTRTMPMPEVLTVDSSSDSSEYSDAQDTLTSGEEEEAEPDPLESLDDSLFVQDSPDDPTSRAMKEPLLPQECLEPNEALQHFTQKFEQRYGATHPLFYIGSLSDAVEEATSGSILSESRKPLFIYLHHDASVLSNVFCSQLLCSDSVVNFLTTNYITWAWDLTFHEHKLKLLQMVEECFGAVAKLSVSSVQPDHLPAILIVYKIKSSIDIRQIIQGETNLDLLMTTLITSTDDHQMHVAMEAREERERLAREEMIQEQNQAYLASLSADKEKQKLKDIEEMLKVEKEKVEQQQRLEEEERRQVMEDSVPLEPLVNCGEKLSTIKIRFPDGTTMQRRFLARHYLKDLMNFFGAKKFLPSEYKILTGFPRKDLSTMDASQTLEQAGLCPQETLFVEER